MRAIIQSCRALDSTALLQQYTSRCPLDKENFFIIQTTSHKQACILVKENRIRRYKELIIHIYHQSSLSSNYITAIKNIFAISLTRSIYFHFIEKYCEICFVTQNVNDTKEEGSF